MIEAREVLTGKINSKKGILVGKVNIGIKEIYPPLIDLEATPTKEVQEFNHENEYGYDKVKVNPIPDEYIIPNGELDINANGEVDVTTFRMARVGVKTPPTLQDKSVEITKNGTTNIVADEGYDGLNNVEVTTNINTGETPTNAIYFDKWNDSGYPTRAIINWASSTLPSYLFSYHGTSYTQVARYLEEINIEQTGNNCTISEKFCYALTSLKKVSLANTVKRIETSAFSGCTGLTEIDLSNVTYVNTGGFYNCTSLKNVKFNETENWGMHSNAFYQTAIEELISNKLTGIGQTAFCNCTNLKKVSVKCPQTNMVANQIGNRAFKNCTSLISGAFDSLTEYLSTSSGQGAFGNCTSLKAVWLGARITTKAMGRYMFEGCTSMKKIYINSPRATVEAQTNYQYAFSNNAFSTDIIVCNDDEGFMTKEEFDAIDWSTYTG